MISECNPLSIRESEFQGVALLSIGGDTDGNELAFRELIEHYCVSAAQAIPLVVDLSGIDYLSADCLGALLRLNQEMSMHDMNLVLVVRPESPRDLRRNWSLERILGERGLSSVFTTAPTLEAAQQYLLR